MIPTADNTISNYCCDGWLQEIFKTPTIIANFLKNFLLHFLPLPRVYNKEQLQESAPQINIIKRFIEIDFYNTTMAWNEQNTLRQCQLLLKSSEALTRNYFLYHLLIEIFSINVVLEIRVAFVDFALKKNANYFHKWSSLWLLHDFWPFVQSCLFRQQTWRRFSLPGRDCILLIPCCRRSLDDSPLDVALDPVSFELPDVGWQRSDLKLVIPLGWGIERVLSARWWRSSDDGCIEVWGVRLLKYVNAVYYRKRLSLIIYWTPTHFAEIEKQFLICLNMHAFQFLRADLRPQIWAIVIVPFRREKFLIKTMKTSNSLISLNIRI